MCGSREVAERLKIIIILKRANTAPPAKSHWRSNIKCWLGYFVILEGIRNSIAFDSFSFVIFREGIGVAPITQLRMCVIKIVTFKGGRLMW